MYGHVSECIVSKIVLRMYAQKDALTVHNSSVFDVQQTIDRSLGGLPSHDGSHS